MRVATFVHETAGGAVEIAVTRFEGDTGGLAANVNRWRGQLGLGGLSEAEAEAAVERFERDGWSGYALRIRGQGQETLAAGVYEQAEDRTWFVRVTASTERVDEVEAAFMAFARSIGAAGGS